MDVRAGGFQDYRTFNQRPMERHKIGIRSSSFLQKSVCHAPFRGQSSVLHFAVDQKLMNDPDFHEGTVITTPQTPVLN